MGNLNGEGFMGRFMSSIVDRQGRPRGTSFPGGPIMELTVGDYYLVAILEPVYQLAIMRHEAWGGGTRDTTWSPYIPLGLPFGVARVIPLVHLGSEAV